MNYNFFQAQDNKNFLMIKKYIVNKGWSKSRNLSEEKNYPEHKFSTIFVTTRLLGVKFEEIEPVHISFLYLVSGSRYLR